MASPPLWEVPWHLLSPLGKVRREKALEILKEMRRTETPLSNFAMPEGMTEKSLIDNIRGALKRSGKTWAAKPTDRISRGLNIIEDGRVTSIEVDDSVEASKAGGYRYAVGKFLETGYQTYLDRFKAMTIRDSSGAEHTFETDPDRILDALKRYEGGTYEVY